MSAAPIAPMQPAYNITKQNQEDSDAPSSINQPSNELLSYATVESSHSSMITWSTQKDGTLCKRCGSLDMNDILSKRPKTSRGRQIMNLGRTAAPELDPSCSFCRLLFSMKPANCGCGADSTLHLYSFASDKRLWSYKDEVVLLVVNQKCTTSSHYSYSVESLCSTSPPSYVNGDTLRARLIAPGHIDYSIIRKWITLCGQNHRLCKRVPFQKPILLQFIDCHTRKVVSGDTTYRYVALSYVWGTLGCQPTSFFGKKVLPEEKLNTIEDAITVTKMLGVQYLWIDRYCIDQRDLKEKHSQLRQMDKIYLGAYVTIVAVAGSDPTYGLPGVGRKPRVAQPHSKMGKHILASLMEPPQSLIGKSVWTSRGWTYQEALCSQRRLIFTDQYVYFECAEANWSETCDLERSWSGWNIFMRGSIGKYPWKILTNISDYNKRQLTYESDALNGILGILRRFEEEPKYPVYHFWGVPVLPCVRKHENGQAVYVQRTMVDRFLSGLCWKSKSPGNRRARFPSWSWTGWSCEVEEVSPEYENTHNFMSNLDIEIHVFDCVKNSLVGFEAVLESYRKDTLSYPNPPMLHMTGLVVDLCISGGYQNNLKVTKDGNIFTLTLLPVLECYDSPENMKICVDVTITESIQESEINGKLLSQPIKGILLGNSIRDNRSDVLFILVVRRVRKNNGADEYERFGSGRVWPTTSSISSQLFERATRQSILLA